MPGSFTTFFVRFCSVRFCRSILSIFVRTGTWWMVVFLYMVDRYSFIMMVLFILYMERFSFRYVLFIFLYMYCVYTGVTFWRTVLVLCTSFTFTLLHLLLLRYIFVEPVHVDRCTVQYTLQVPLQLPLYTVSGWFCSSVEFYTYTFCILHFCLFVHVDFVEYSQ